MMDIIDDDGGGGGDNGGGDDEEGDEDGGGGSSSCCLQLRLFFSAVGHQVNSFVWKNCWQPKKELWDAEGETEVWRRGSYCVALKSDQAASE